MKIKILFIYLIISFISCKDQNKGSELSNSEQNSAEMKDKRDIKIDKAQIIENLQGKWKEIEYPYRTVDFENSTVKFVEEGTLDKPRFQKFAISTNCRFDNNNIRDVRSRELILTLPNKNRCEKLKVSNDTLTLSGFSTNTNSEYKIIYLKEGQ